MKRSFFRKKIVILTFIFAFFPFSARTAVFDLQIIQPGTGINTTLGFNSVMDIFNAYEQGDLDQYFTGFDNNLAATGYLNFRGISMSLDYNGSNNLNLKIPAIDIDLNFNGSNLETAFNSFEDYLKDNQDDLMHKVLKESVSQTPFDAVAGNPGSLMAQMADIAFHQPVLNVATATKKKGNFVFLAPSVALHSIKHQNTETDVTTVHLPLGYVYRFRNDWAVGIDMPLSYIDTDGSDTFAGQIGMTLQIPLWKGNAGSFFQHWYVLPSGRIGATGSEDLLSGGLLYMGSLTSNMTFSFGKGIYLDMTNMGSIVRDHSLTFDGYDIEYNLRNNVFKNGAKIRYRYADAYEIGVFFTNTQYTGTDLYIDKYNEVGLSFSRLFHKNRFISGVNLFAGYTFADNYDGIRAGLNILF